MKKKIPVKTFYLLAVISIGLIGLAAGSTYAMFTASAEISNPITLAFNLAETSETLETVPISAAPGDTESVELEIHNTVTKKLNYAIWYITNNPDVTVSAVAMSGSSIHNAIGTMDAAFKSYNPDLYVGTISISVRNTGTTIAVVDIGISSSVDQVVLSDKMKIIGNWSNEI